MDSESHSLDALDLPQQIDYDDTTRAITTISVSELEDSEFRGIKSQLYSLVESANNLRMRIKVRNLEKLGNHEVNCTHLMKSCQRESSELSDVYMILKSLVSSTTGSKVHWIEIVE